MKIVISTNIIAALRWGRFVAFGDPGLSIFILRCARAGHGGLYENPPFTKGGLRGDFHVSLCPPRSWGLVGL